MLRSYFGQSSGMPKHFNVNVTPQGLAIYEFGR